MSGINDIRGVVSAMLGSDPDKMLELHRIYGEQLASLKADRDTFNNRRDSIIAMMKMRIREDCEKKGKKVTDGYCEDHALSCEQYVNWLKSERDKMEAYERKRAEYENADKCINYYQTLIAFAKVELTRI